MFYEQELTFLKNILKNFSIDTHLIVDGVKPTYKIDRGIRDYICGDESYEDFMEALKKKLSPNTILSITDFFMCSYVFILLPDTDETSVLSIGPYSVTDFSEEGLLQLAEKENLNPKAFAQIKKYYSNIPLVSNEETINAIVCAFGEKIWGSSDKFIIKTIKNLFADEFDPVTIPSGRNHNEDATLSINALESRYEAERELMLAVSQGMAHKAELLLGNSSELIYERRVDDPIRNIKNYTIILNTLLRKSAEYGSVHPLYIDSLSSDFAEKIENLNSPEAAFELQKEMVYKYCQLVKKHSMKNYSLLVQKVLTRIDTDLTADLSLNTQAEILNINPSYLSALFKKETGVTLTEYVNRKRTEHAIHLLTSTNMQIQTIAQYCGIMDVNYFTKIFKKYVGKTPKEYREHGLRFAKLK